jgi:hypothetical protein
MTRNDEHSWANSHAVMVMTSEVGAAFLPPGGGK